MARSTAKRIAAAAAKKVTSGVSRRPAAGSRTTPAKKTPAKKAPAKKAPAKKAPAKKAPAKKAPAKKAPAKKAPAKKAPAKKAPAKKAPAKKAPAKKAPAKKAPAKNRGAKTVSAHSVVSARPATRRPAPPTRRSGKTQARDLAVKADESPWTTAELAEVRGELNADATRLRAELNAADEELADLMRDAGDGAGNDQADVGSTTFERDHEMSLANNAREMLAQTERALARIDDGSYGVCESCGQPIGKMRVMAFPRATLCLPCKQREERR